VTRGTAPEPRRPLGVATGDAAEDPFGPGDPLEVARLVRRSLAAARRRADAVGALVVVTDRTPPPAALARFTRRALGPHGAEVAASSRLVPPEVDHGERVASATAFASGASVTIVVVLGPGDGATALCLG
jgi:hypothetical protein